MILALLQILDPLTVRVPPGKSRWQVRRSDPCLSLGVFLGGYQDDGGGRVKKSLLLCFRPTSTRRLQNYLRGSLVGRSSDHSLDRKQRKGSQSLNNL